MAAYGNSSSSASPGLFPFGTVFPLEDYVGKPLPCDIYNADFGVRARAGQKVSREQLAGSYVLTAQATPVDRVITSRPRGTGYDMEESVRGIEKSLEGLDFAPIEAVRQGIRKNAGEMRDLYRRTMVADASLLISRNGPDIAESIARFLLELYEDPAMVTDYADSLSAVRNRSNYLTFGHGTAMALYALGIAQKLRMLRADFITRPNAGRWLPVRTARKPRGAASVPFSNQLLESIDRFKILVQTKYTRPVQEKILERVHDLMHEYAALDYSENYPSLSVEYDETALLQLATAGLTADIGKVALSPEALTRPGPLEGEEEEKIKEHPVTGVALMRKAGFDQPRVLGIILGHHRLTETIGYPVLPRAPLLESKLIAISDLYDAMRSERHYGKVHDQNGAFQNLADLVSAGAFDPPLWIAARHTFEELNHDFIKARTKASSRP